MNGLQGPGLGHVRQSSDGNNSAVVAPTVGSPTKARPGSSTGKKRTQDLAGVEGSPGSVENWEERDESRIGVKRACNECRQQKVRLEGRDTLCEGKQRLTVHSGSYAVM